MPMSLFYAAFSSISKVLRTSGISVLSVSPERMRVESFCKTGKKPF